MSYTHLDWKFCQVFGDTTALEQTQEADIINAVQFNSDGNYLAAGDRGGRIVVFNRSERAPRRSRDGSLHPNVEYRFFSEFQSHEPAFDSLRSNEISESINVISFLENTRNCVNMLTANDKTIKLWKVQTRPVFTYSGLNKDLPASSLKTPADLKVPTSSLGMSDQGDAGATNVITTPAAVYDKAHAFRIHSVCPMADGQNFISSDELSVLQWNIDSSSKAVVLADIKPADLNDLQEVITCATCQRSMSATAISTGLMAFGTSRGIVNIIDTRACRNSGNLVDASGGTGTSLNVAQLTHDCGISADQYMREYVSSINDVAFSPDGPYLIARSYYHILAWDVRYPSNGPVMQVPVCPYLAPLTPRLCAKDSVFDRFTLALGTFPGTFAPSSPYIRQKPMLGIRYIITGGYNYTFNIVNTENNLKPSVLCARATRQAMHPSSRRSVNPNSIEAQPAPGLLIPKGKPGASIAAAEFYHEGRPQNVPTATLGEYGGQVGGSTAPYRVDLSRKALYIAAHPNDHVIAVATTANLFIYGAVENDEFAEKNKS